MLAYSGRMFAGSLKLSGLLIIVLGAAGLISLGFDQITPDFSSFIISWPGIGLSVVAASLYVMVRQRVIGSI